ncbi:unnamed protein product [Prorocentrum cordatum]|uniref:Uncharacterized protein n=1 Tax=Prorocentrum cordatum TaxID=2364126 RepID=A0ABN9RUK9_9DINO|nr:unnamed protein product [Polarella glacialis]|mmetsp:Transcript_42094/g.113086  ORF Transcript_42094/g.113086 Transcript_42094/m.113086 type:complete len:441 (+) Transcript_42094:116-1438(+)
MAAGRRPRRPSEALWRPQRERRAAQRWAALSRERLVERQASELVELRSLASAPPSVLRRLALVAPALIAQEYGGPLEEERILERNVGCHARAIPRPGAPRAAWRTAQRGPRLPCPRSAVAASSAEVEPRAVGADAIHVADFEAELLAEADAQASGGAFPPPPGVRLVADPLAGARAFREGFDAGWRLAGTASGAPRGGDGGVLQEQCVPSSSFRGVWEVCSDGACGGGQAAPAARAKPGPPCEGVWKEGAAMEEGGRAALHAPCRAFDGVQGGIAGERAPRPPLLLESLAGPGSDDGFDDGFVDGPVDGGAGGDAACPGPPARSEPDSRVLEYRDRFGAAVLGGGTAVELERGTAGSERAAAAASAERCFPFLDEFDVAAVAAAARGPLSGVESPLDLAEGRAEGWLLQRELTLGDRAEVEALAGSLLLQKGVRSDSLSR